MKVHPLALTCPEMSQEEYAALLGDIKTRGLLQPIVMFKKAILDGRHRARACEELGITPKIREFKGNDDAAAAFVISANVHRRHLTREQKRAVIVAELKRDPAQSDRSIAKKAKVSAPTVAKERAANVNTLHSGERTEATGRKARGRKPKLAAVVTKPKDLDAARILREIGQIAPNELTDPYGFGGSLFIAAKRFAMKINLRRG